MRRITRIVTVSASVMSYHPERVGHVILSEAKDLSLGRAQILCSAQDDSSAERSELALREAKG